MYEQRIRQLEERIRLLEQETARIPARFAPGGGGSVSDPTCTAQNTVQQITVLGSPIAGTFDWTLIVDGTSETLTFNFDDDANEVATELATHPAIGSTDNVTVSFGPFPDTVIQIEFIGDLANTDVPTGAAGGFGNLVNGIGVITSTVQIGIAEG